jgi:hypothetical protein
MRETRARALAVVAALAVTVIGLLPAEASPARSVVKRTIGTGLSDVAVDANGNAYVVGSAKNAMLLAKYGPAGSLLWQRRWEPFAQGQAYANDVAIAPGGGVYVVGGVSIPHYEGGSWFISRYGPDGGLRWRRATPGWRKHPHRVTYSAVASQGDLAVVAMNRYGCCASAADDGWVRAYGSNGTIRWTRPYEAPSVTGTNDRVNDVAIGGSGTVYVAGHIEMRPRGSVDQWAQTTILVQKLTALGGLIWARFLRDGTPHESDDVAAISVRANEFMLTGVTGTRFAPTTNDPRRVVPGSAYVARWSFGGQQLWRRTWGGHKRWNAVSPSGIDIKSSGTVAVVGRISGHEGKKGFQRRYAPGGDFLRESRMWVGAFGDASGVDTGSATWVAGTIYGGSANWGTGVLWRFDR